MRISHHSLWPQEFPVTLSKVKVVWGGDDLDNDVDSGEAENGQQGNEYIVKFRKISGDDNKGGEGHIK